MTDTLCGKNLYLLLFAKNGAFLQLAKFDVRSQLKTADKKILIDSPIVNADAVCLQDSEGLDEALAVVLLFENQTQAVYRFLNESEEESLPSLELRFREQQTAHLSDFDCEVAGKPQPQPAASNSYLTKFKCFYSTRWADDYVVYYGIESGPSHFRLQEARTTQTVQEVNHFSPLQTKAYKDWVIIFGENLQEPPLARSFYALMYAFDLADTHVVTYIKIPKSIDVDAKLVSDLYSICNDGSFIHLFASERKTNTYDQVVRFRLGKLELEVSNQDFRPSEVDLEMLTIDGEPLQKINLGGLFDLREESGGLASKLLPTALLSVLLLSLLGLAASLCFWLAVHRSYTKARDRCIASLGTMLSPEQAARFERQIDEVFEVAPQELLEYRKDKRSLLDANDGALVELLKLN